MGLKSVARRQFRLTVSSSSILASSEDAVRLCHCDSVIDSLRWKLQIIDQVITEGLLSLRSDTSVCPVRIDCFDSMLFK